MEIKEQQFDAVSLGILWNRLVSITDEIESTLVRTSFSTIVSESYDLTVVILDRQGRLVAQGSHLCAIVEVDVQQLRVRDATGPDRRASPSTPVLGVDGLIILGGCRVWPIAGDSEGPEVAAEDSLGLSVLPRHSTRLPSPFVNKVVPLAEVGRPVTIDGPRNHRQRATSCAAHGRECGQHTLI